ncbi:hypothetical protein [Sphingopyxis terrae]|uniref:hypothetical protein n=1 Tax=Sphingopyxis terrae TaxID=33052 RepID=UPI000AF6D17D|nr:hypothetical protein [Sphingopyxis terrae]
MSGAFGINAECRAADLTVAERNAFAQFALGWFSITDPKEASRALEVWLAERRQERKAA